MKRALTVIVQYNAKYERQLCMPEVHNGNDRSAD